VPPPENVAFVNRVQCIYQDKHASGWNSSNSEALAKTVNELDLTETTESGLSYEVQECCCLSQVPRTRLARNRFSCSSGGKSSRACTWLRATISVSALRAYDRFRVLEKR
jgi:hypothetical protein